MKILVVEDEDLSREEIIRILCKIGYCEVCSAINGVEACRLLETDSFDLILSDIRMPQMDGLELLRYVKCQAQNTIFIILSGYDLFDYARAALSNGAFGYLLKPIDIKELDDTIQKVELHLKKMLQNQKREMEMEDQINHTNLTLRNRYLADLLCPADRTANQIEKQYPNTCISFSHPIFSVLLLDLSQLSSLQRNEFSLLLPSLSAPNTAGTNCQAYCFAVDSDFACLYNYSDSFDLNSHSALLLSELKQTGDLPLRAGLGKPVSSLDLLERAYTTARKALLQPADPQESSLHIYQDNYRNDQSVASTDFRFEKELMSLFEQADPDSCISCILMHYRQLIDFEKFDIEMFKKLNLYVILSIYKILSQLNLEPQHYLGDEFESYRQLNQLHAFEDIEGWYCEALTPAITSLGTLDRSDSDLLISSAQTYIRNHLSKGITLEKTASHVNLSPTYFSRFFKQETGTGFADYVTGLRIETAGFLLRDTFEKVGDIAQKVGIQDLRYFYKIFKKHTGFTPTEYRKRYHNSP